MPEIIEQPSSETTDHRPTTAFALLSAACRLPGKTTDWFPEAVPSRASVAVLIPCFNEEAAIGKVIADFRAALPDATIYVYDNNSTDRTVMVAEASGAVVRAETLQGKGHVVRRMFADIQADVYVLVDGDDTYDARAAPAMARLLLARRLDMVSAARDTPESAAYRLGHRLGNLVLSGMVRRVFGSGISDMLSGFETETEFTVHALALNMPVLEIYASYRSRPAGSQSKLKTFADGFRILREIVTLIEHERPLSCAAVMTAILLLLALALGLPLVIAFVHTGLVDRLPTAVLAASLVLLASLSLGCGLILDAVAHGRKELKRLAYLAIPFLPGA